MKIKPPSQIAGEQFTRGMLSEICSWIWLPLLVALIIQLITSFAHDTTDPGKGYFDRSGLTVRTDHATGVEYVFDGHGGMCVRIDRDGKPFIEDRK